MVMVQNSDNMSYWWNFCKPMGIGISKQCQIIIVQLFGSPNSAPRNSDADGWFHHYLDLDSETMMELLILAENQILQE